MGNLSKKFSVLGTIADPDVSRTFALNYYSIPRGRIQDEKLAAVPEMVSMLKAEPAFQRQFRGSVSGQSFDSMIEDRVTGGTEYFFKHLTEQIRSGEEGNGIGQRQSLLGKKEENALSEMGELLARNELIPEPKPRDLRKEHLNRFCDGLEKAIDSKNEKELRAINHALRLFLNVDYRDLNPVPTDQFDINLDHLRTQCNQWIVAQMSRFQESGASDGDPDWALIGLDRREEFYETLNAIVQSIEPELEQTTIWLRKLSMFAQASGIERTFLRRHLAIRLGNAIVYGPGGARVTEINEIDDFGGDAEELPFIGSEPKGKQCKYYKHFIEPFAGPNGHLVSLIERSVVPVTRPDQEGDQELLENKFLTAFVKNVQN